MSSIQTKRPRRSFGSLPLPMTRKEAGSFVRDGKKMSAWLKQRRAIENVREYFECERRDYEGYPSKDHIWLDMKIVIELLNELVARKQFVEGRKG